VAGTDLVKHADVSAYPILQPGGLGDDLAEVLAENLGGDQMTQFDFDRVKMPTGGAVNWEIPTLDGPTAAPVIEGVIVKWATVRTYWVRTPDDPESSGDAPPDCSSPDGHLGYGMYGVGSDLHPSGECQDCPMSQWESKPGGRGQACKQSRLLFMLLPGAILPTTVSLPPTSLSAARSYMTRLTSQGISYYGVVTKIRLEKAQNAGGQKYSKAVLEKGDTLDDAARDLAREYGRQLSQMLAATAGTTAPGSAPTPPEPGQGVAGDAAPSTATPASDAWGDQQ